MSCQIVHQQFFSVTCAAFCSRVGDITKVGIDMVYWLQE